MRATQPPEGLLKSYADYSSAGFGDAETAESLRRESFQANLPIALWVAAINAVVLTAIAWLESANPAYLVWAGLVLAAGGGRGLLLMRDRMRRDRPGQPAWPFYVTAAISGAIWGGFLFLIPDVTGSITQIAAIFMLSGMAAAAALAFSAYIGLVLCFNGPLLGSTFAYLILSERAEQQVLSVVVLLFFFATTAIAWRARRQLGRAVAARAAAERQVAEIGRLAASLNQSAREAEANSRAKSVFLARMSHDLRTPLNGVIGLSQLLETTELRDDQQEFVRTISQSGRTLLGLIENLLELARLEGGLAELDRGEFDLRGLLDDMADAASRQVHERPVKVKLDIDADLPAIVWGDERRLRQAVGALVSNAAHFTRKGEICIAARLAEKGRIRFEIADTGDDPGESAASALVERPLGDGRPAPRRAGSAGIGLDIARSIATLTQGEIGAERTAAGGARFWLEMPLRDADSADTLPLAG